MLSVDPQLVILDSLIKVALLHSSIDVGFVFQSYIAQRATDGPTKLHDSSVAII